jgi:hypothetical protein
MANVLVAGLVLGWIVAAVFITLFALQVVKQQDLDNTNTSDKVHPATVEYYCPSNRSTDVVPLTVPMTDLVRGHVVTDVSLREVQKLFEEFVPAAADVTISHALHTTAKRSWYVMDGHPGDLENVLTKCRSVGSKAVIGYIRPWRHLKGVNQLDVVAYTDKLDVAVWRGATTGPVVSEIRATRFDLVDRYEHDKSGLVDVGFSISNQTHTRKTKKKLNHKQQRQYKMIIVVEGNDVASGLAAALSSNSVVIMSAPTMETWLAQGLLQPYVHYVPVKQDFSDLLTQVQWVLENETQALQIVDNAHRFIAPFRNRKYCREMSNAVLTRFLND